MFSDNGSSAKYSCDLTGFSLIRTVDVGSPVCLSKDTARKRLSHANCEFDTGVLEESNWASLWSQNAAIPAACYRELACAAGLHIFNKRNDVLYANRSLIRLHARSAGERVLRFPAKVELHDALSSEQLSMETQEWKVLLNAGETLLYRWLDRLAP